MLLQQHQLQVLRTRTPHAAAATHGAQKVLPAWLALANARVSVEITCTQHSVQTRHHKRDHVNLHCLWSGKGWCSTSWRCGTPASTTSLVSRMKLMTSRACHSTAEFGTGIRTRIRAHVPAGKMWRRAWAAKTIRRASQPRRAAPPTTTCGPEPAS
jgi:hypothetical protein